MELKRIIISEIHEQQVILLKEVEGDRNFSIMIGIFEATSIDRRVKRLPSPGPSRTTSWSGPSTPSAASCATSTSAS